MNAWSSTGAFTWSKPFWEQPAWRWDAMFAAGVRAHYVASQAAAGFMVARKRSLISAHFVLGRAEVRCGNVAYGIAKAATDKMTSDMAVELRPHGVAVVSLYPWSGADGKGHGRLGMAGPLEFRITRVCRSRSGCAHHDPEVMRHSGTRQVAASLAAAYGFTDLDGKSPRPLTLADV